jgi:hypothetical protein
VKHVFNNHALPQSEKLRSLSRNDECLKWQGRCQRMMEYNIYTIPELHSGRPPVFTSIQRGLVLAKKRLSLLFGGQATFFSWSNFRFQ